MSTLGSRESAAKPPRTDGNLAANGHAPAQPTASLIDLLHRVTQVATQRFATSVGDEGPTPRQLAVLGSIGASDGLSQTQISDATGIDRATTAEIVGRLNRMGLIKRRRTRHDARTYAVGLTEKGQLVLAETRATASRIENELLDQLPPDDRAQLMSLLARLAASPNSNT